MKFWTFGITALTLLLASAIAPAAQAQVNITGGNGTILNGRIFVPTTGRLISPSGSPDRGSEVKSLVYGSAEYKGLLIKTEQGNLPTNLLFRANLVPTFETGAGENPTIGTKGIIDGLVSFRGFNNSGRPFFYNNIPTKLNIELTQVPSSSNSIPTTEWNAFGFVLTEVGRGSTPSTSTVVTRETNVRLLQYQDRGDAPVDRTVLGNSIPASAYDVRRNGTSYGGDIKFDINSGIFGDGTVTTARLVEVLSNPNSPPTNPTPNPRPNPTTDTPNPNPIVIGYLPMIVTKLQGGSTTWYTIPRTVYTPMLGGEVKIIVRGRKVQRDETPKPDKTPRIRFDPIIILPGFPKPDNTPKPEEKPEEVVIDTEEIVYVDNTTQKTYVTVGLPSRIFPNFMGLEEVDLKKD